MFTLPPPLWHTHSWLTKVWLQKTDSVGCRLYMWIPPRIYRLSWQRPWRWHPLARWWWLSAQGSSPLRCWCGRRSIGQKKFLKKRTKHHVLKSHKQSLGVLRLIGYLQKSLTYVFAHFLHRFSFLEAKKRENIEMLGVFPTGIMTLYMVCLLCWW